MPSDVVLPFLKRESLERYGSYGVLYRLTVPGQHLRSYDDTVRLFLAASSKRCLSYTGCHCGKTHSANE